MRNWPREQKWSMCQERTILTLYHKKSMPLSVNNNANTRNTTIVIAKTMSMALSLCHSHCDTHPVPLMNTVLTFIFGQSQLM